MIIFKYKELKDNKPRLKYEIDIKILKTVSVQHPRILANKENMYRLLHKYYEASGCQSCKCFKFGFFKNEKQLLKINTIAT